MFGVRPIIPCVYAPTFQVPMSSPKITTMLGFCCAVSSGATASIHSSANQKPWLALFMFPPNQVNKLWPHYDFPREVGVGDFSFSVESRTSADEGACTP